MRSSGDSRAAVSIHGRRRARIVDGLGPEPDRFNPDRWASLGRKPGALETAQFAGGPHFCLGYHMAWLEAVQYGVTLARTLGTVNTPACSGSTSSSVVTNPGEETRQMLAHEHRRVAVVGLARDIDARARACGHATRRCIRPAAPGRSASRGDCCRTRAAHYGALARGRAGVASPRDTAKGRLRLARRPPESACRFRWASGQSHPRPA